MKNIILKFYILILFFCSTTVLFATPGDGNGGTGNGALEGDDPVVPIDNYLWIVALVGLFFIFMKFRTIQKNKIQN